jgi:hypothetical protein
MFPCGSLATPQIKFDQYGIATSSSFHASHLAARGLFIHFRSFFGGIETRAEIQLLVIPGDFCLPLTVFCTTYTHMAARVGPYFSPLMCEFNARHFQQI